MGNLKDASAKSLGLDPEKLLASFGPMIDNMIIAVPLEQFEEIKIKNPEAKIVPLMTDEQIKFEETRLFLGLVNMISEDLPDKFKGMKNGIFKLAFGMAYGMEKDEKVRARFMIYVNKVSRLADNRKETVLSLREGK